MQKRFFFCFLKLQLKKAFYYFPKIILGELILLFVVAAVIFSASKLLYQEDRKEKLTIALSMPEDSKSEKWMMSIVEQMGSVKENCNFVEVKEKEALKMVKEGQAYAAIVLPENFLDGIISGKNIPAEIYLSSSPLEKQLIQLFTQSGAASLAAAQSGIYALSDFVHEQNQPQLISKIEEDLNRLYIQFALNREDYFKYIQLNATGELSVIQYYIGSGIVLFLLFSLLAFGSILKSENKSFYFKLKIAGITPFQFVAAKVMTVFIPLFFISCITFAVCSILGYFSDFSLFIPFVLAFIIVIFTISCYGVFLFLIAKTPFSAGLCIFLSTIVMLFLSGGFIPSVLLPQSFSLIAKFIPTTAMIYSVNTLFLKQYHAIGICFLWGILFFIISIFLFKEKNIQAKEMNN